MRGVGAAYRIEEQLIMALQDARDWAQGSITNINGNTTTVVNDAMTTLRTEMTQRFGVVDDRLGNIETKQGDLESRLGALENRSTTPTSEFQPKHVDIKGFCAWGKRRTEGIDRARAAEVYQALKRLVPSELQSMVGEFQLASGRINSIRIPINSKVIMEISNTWNDYLKTPGNTFQGKQLYVVRQAIQTSKSARRLFGGSRTMSRRRSGAMCLSK